MTNVEWIEVDREKPEDGLVVETKIDGQHGCRNEGKLYRSGNLWFVESGAMYVYYRPTHWRRLKAVSQ